MNQTNQLTILKAEQTQAPEISALIGEVLGSYDLYHLRPSYVDEDVNDLLSNYFNNNGYFWSAHDEVGTIVATVAVYRIDDQTCELKKMYLRLQDQGKGIGKQLLNIAIDKARELGYAKMVLKTNSKLKTAIGLYQKYGFERYTISDEDKKTDCDVAMELYL